MKKEFYTPISILIAALIIFAGLFGLDLLQTNSQVKTISVTGESSEQRTNEVATFSAGVSVSSENKQEATQEVNDKVQKILDSVKTFGIPTEDIKTESVSIYQEEDYETNKITGWRASNTVSIKLRDSTKADQLTDLLANTDATSVYGPSFELDNSDLNKDSLYAVALKNATNKAENMANSFGGKLGKVLHVTEGYNTNSPVLFERASGLGGGGAPIEPGSSNVNATVTVVYELVY